MWLGETARQKRKNLMSIGKGEQDVKEKEAEMLT